MVAAGAISAAAEAGRFCVNAEGNYCGLLRPLTASLGVILRTMRNEGP